MLESGVLPTVQKVKPLSITSTQDLWIRKVPTTFALLQLMLMKSSVKSMTTLK